MIFFIVISLLLLFILIDRFINDAGYVWPYIKVNATENKKDFAYFKEQEKLEYKIASMLII